MSESRQRLYRTEGIVIRRTDSGEADRVLTLYTPQRGKFRAIVRGVRRPGSRMAGHVELLTYSSFLLARGRNLDIITQAQTLAAFPNLRTDLEKIGWGCYAAELLDRLAPEGAENYPAFQLFLEALTYLDQGENAEMTARSFELHLLGYMGYRPQLFRCVACNSPTEAQSLSFSAALGGVLCPRCREQDRQARPMSPEALKTLRYLQGNGLAEAGRLHLSENTRGEVEELLYYDLRTIMEREVNAVEFLETLRQRRARPLSKQRSVP